MKSSANYKLFSTLAVPSFLVLTVLFGSLNYACFEGGANMNEHSPGNQEGGVDLGGDEDGEPDDLRGLHFGSIAVDKRGRYFITALAGKLVYGDLQLGGVKVIESVQDPERAAFGNMSDVFYVTSDSQNRLTAIDPGTRDVIWSVYADIYSTRPWLDVTKDDRMIILTYQRRVEILDSSDGSLISQYQFDRNIFDTDIIHVSLDGDPVEEPEQKEDADGGMDKEEPVDGFFPMPVQDDEEEIIEYEARKLVVTLEHEWEETGSEDTPFVPRAEVHIIDLDTMDKRMLAVPNCSSELVIDPAGKYGFLAPTFCRSPAEECDPVSVIDFHNSRFIRNLPGFGPVALSPLGNTAVAFMDTENLDESLFDDPSQIPSPPESRYYIMVINTKNLRFESYPIGEELPRYALTPDGNILLIDFDMAWGEASMRILDLVTGIMNHVTGPVIQMDEYVFTRDSTRAYIIYSALFELQINTANVIRLLLDFQPSSLNITPDDRYLLLKDRDAGYIWQYSVGSQRIVRKFVPPRF